MKKLLSVIIAMVLAMAFFTGCVKNEETKGDAEPTPSPTPAQTETTEDEEDPNYATVLAMWQDMDGYWVNADGQYLQFKLDENGKAEMFIFDKDGNQTAAMKASAVMASNKMSYYMAFETAQTGYFIELEGYGDGYVKIAQENDSAYTVYVSVGENLEKLADAVKTAKDLAKE